MLLPVHASTYKLIDCQRRLLYPRAHNHGCMRGVGSLWGLGCCLFGSIVETTFSQMSQLTHRYFCKYRYGGLLAWASRQVRMTGARDVLQRRIRLERLEPQAACLLGHDADTQLQPTPCLGTLWQQINGAALGDWRRLQELIVSSHMCTYADPPVPMGNPENQGHAAPA